MRFAALILTAATAAGALAQPLPQLASPADGGAGSGPTVVSRSQQGPVRMSVTIDRQIAAIAEPFRLTWEVTAPAGTVVTSPNLGDSLEPFTLRNQTFLKDLPSGDDESTRLWKWQLVLDSLKSGELEIPAMEFPYRVAAADAGGIIRSDPVRVRITSLLEDRADPTDFRDLKEPVDLPIPEPTVSWIPAALAVVGVTAVCGLLAMIAVARRRRQMVPPATWAYAQIELLEQTVDLEPTTADAISTELTSILREYLVATGRVEGDPVVGSRGLNGTTTQTPPAITAAFSLGSPATSAAIDVPQEARQPLEDLMRCTDEAKFARRPLSESQIREAIDQCRTVVRLCAAADAAARKEAG